MPVSTPDTSTPRVLVFSQRNITSKVFQCFLFEFEDVIQTVDSVEICAPPMAMNRAGSLFLHRAMNQLRKLADVCPAGNIQAVTIEKSSQLFFASFQFAHQISHLTRLKGWDKRCDVKVCYLAELWTKDIEHWSQYLQALNQFDYIFVSSQTAADALSLFLKRKCLLLPFAVDMKRFYREGMSPRSIDVLAIGRQPAAAHKRFLQAAANDHIFYHYDTTRNFNVTNYAEHRLLLADLIRRSQFFLSYKHNVTMPEFTGGDEALGVRNFEGCAGGAVLLGCAPSCPEYTQCFDWSDSLIEIPVDPVHAGDLIRELLFQSERITRIRYNNISQCLRRHDWAHRWQMILQTAGIPVIDKLQLRTDALEQLSCTVSASEAPRRATHADVQVAAGSGCSVT